MSTTKIFSFNIYFWSIPTLTFACIEDQNTSVYCKEGSLRLKYADQKLPHKTLPKLKVCTPQVGYLWIIIPLHVKNSLDLFFEIGQDSKCGWKILQQSYDLRNSCKKLHSIYPSYKPIEKQNPSHLLILTSSSCYVSRVICTKMSFPSDALSCSCWLGCLQRFSWKTEEQDK